MKTLLQVNTVINSGSHGRIAESLGKLAVSNGWKSYIAYGRNTRPSESEVVKIGSIISIYLHVFLTRVFDAHGFGSYFATKKFVKQIRRINPTVIHLQNIHGYYLNIAVLFKYLRDVKIPVIWTLHDCWSFTGHCSHYTFSKCKKWKRCCFNCSEKKSYPTSLLLDASKSNYDKKKKIFTSLDASLLKIVTPSAWLEKQLRESFLNKYEVRVINNGIDLNIFRPMLVERNQEKIILGVASKWTERKGFEDFVELSKKMNDKYKIILVGLSKKQINDLPKNITGIMRTESQEELAMLYSKADVFLNLTYEDTFPTVNIEALACGTPVITYNVGGSSEIISESTGITLPVGDITAAVKAIELVCERGKVFYTDACVKRAKDNYEKNEKFEEYMKLYDEMALEKKNR